MMQPPPYADLDRALTSLDARSTQYQFDLDADIPWDRIDEPGDYLPPEYLADLGIDVERLQSEPEAWAMFQWAAALLTCEGFIIAEKQILDFFDHEPPLMQRRSNQLLFEEEEKHIALFRRYGDHLRDQHPEWGFDFDRLFMDLGCEGTATRMLRMIEDPAERHYVFWISVVYFEELTLYVHKRLSRASGVQPAWARAHACHMQEEAQHLRTDMAHVEATSLDARGRAAAQSVLEAEIVMDFDRSFGLRVALPMVEEAFPELAPLRVTAPDKTVAYADIVSHHPMFRRTRAILEGGVHAQGRAATVAPEPTSRRSAQEIEAWIVAHLAKALTLPTGDIDVTADLPSLAVDSIKATELSALFTEWLGRPIPPTLLWDHASIRHIAEHYGE